MTNSFENAAQYAQVQYVMSKTDLESAFASVLERILSQRDAEKVDRLLTAAQVAERLHVTRVTLYRWEKAHHLTPIRKGKAIRYRESDVNRLIAE